MSFQVQDQEVYQQIENLIKLENNSNVKRTRTAGKEKGSENKKSTCDDTIKIKL